MNRADITIILPLKNYHREFLRQALDSVMHQSCARWRLLIVVEPSEFESFQILLEKERRDPRVELMVNQGWRLAGAINSALRNATTDFVALLLADDLWSTDAVKVLNDYIGRYPEVDFFHSSRRYIDETGSFISSVYASKEDLKLDDFRFGPVKHLLCWKRSKALAVGGLDESLTSLVGPDDYDFPWTMAENGATFKSIPECLYYYREHCQSYRLTTHTPLTVNRREVARILKKHHVGIWGRMLRLLKLRAECRIGSPYLYRSKVDKWITDRLGYDVRRRWKPIPFK
jgi:glycosyltransferase involved in cell wall biosynthesis